MYVLLTGINHQTAPVEIRERFSMTPAQMEQAYQQVRNDPALEGVVILNTCNRTELYATTRDLETGQEHLRSFMATISSLPAEQLEEYCYQPNCYDAIEHLFRVSSGLESMIVGETQVLGQVKEAYLKAQELKGSDGVLNSLFQKAIQVGKKVRTATSIDQHPVSVSYAAVELAKKTLGPLQDKTVLVVGAGEMADLATQYLMVNGVSSVIISNRSYEKAVQMAALFDGRAARLDQLSAELGNADIVISCTAARHYVMRESNCRQALLDRKGRKIMMIDVAVPRDIDPALNSIEGVFLYDIDDLQGVIDLNMAARRKAAFKANSIIAAELDDFNQWMASLSVVPVISALKKHGEIIKQNELKKAFNRLGKASDREKEIMTAMAHSIVNQLLHYPVVNLKEMAVSNQGHLYAEIVKKLFSLDLPDEEQGKYAQIKTGNQG
ncbi:MAG: glutamyl-tRNA reductase [Syntrophomonadaceae bacterium]|nr:glutamyl-tRNA reductase [Syntrophomonadaceae bacterium]